jgi:NADPH:quinone reductase-like Zn-dependent oxidoreductase
MNAPLATGVEFFERISDGRLEELRAMKAPVYSSYGAPEVVQIQEVEKPALELADVLIRVHATTLCPADWRYRKADPALSRLFSGLLRPTKIRILGVEFAGTVEAVGESVTKFRPVDPVFGSKGF